MRRTTFLAAAVGLMLGLACAGRGGRGRSPEECLKACDQDCPYRPNGSGGNDEYLKCLDACQAKCAG